MQARKKIEILAFAGSTRAGSFNKKLVNIAAQGAKQAGANVTVINLKDYPMPLYDGDLEQEQGLPKNALLLQAIFEEHDGFLIASPEYNGGYSAVLKNTIDWVSRPISQNLPKPKVFAGKVAAIMAASGGGMGGIRGLLQLRDLLLNIQIMVLPRMGMVPNCFTAFADNGALKETTQLEQIKTIGADLADILKK